MTIQQVSAKVKEVLQVWLMRRRYEFAGVVGFVEICFWN
jgi:hypothetical protein